MPIKEITYSDGIIYLEGMELPGILKSLKIKNAIRYDSAKQAGMSGETKTSMGWEDMSMSVTVELLNDEQSDCYVKLSQLNAIFRSTDHSSKNKKEKSVNPKIYRINNRHAQARGLNEVTFAELETTESDGDDVIEARLLFKEHMPPIVNNEKLALIKQGDLNNAKSGETNPELDQGLTERAGHGKVN